MLDRAKTVCDGDRGAAFGGGVEGGLHDALGGAVEGGGGFVEEAGGWGWLVWSRDLGVDEEGAKEGRERGRRSRSGTYRIFGFLKRARAMAMRWR